MLTKLNNMLKNYLTNRHIVDYPTPRNPNSNLRFVSTIAKRKNPYNKILLNKFIESNFIADRTGRLVWNEIVAIFHSEKKMFEGSRLNAYDVLKELHVQGLLKHRIWENGVFTRMFLGFAARRNPKYLIR